MRLDRALKKLVSEAINSDDRTSLVKRWGDQLSSMLDAINSDFVEVAKDGDLSESTVRELDRLAKLASRVAKIANRLPSMEEYR